MRTIFSIILIALLSTGCEKFLDKSPSEGGIAGFNSADQFDALLNEIRITRNRYEWNHAILGSDDCHYHPDFQTANPATFQQREAQNVWNEVDLKGITGVVNGFVGPWTYMYTFNYITDKIDNPEISGSTLQKKAVKAEAMFFRALYYFTMSVQYDFNLRVPWRITVPAIQSLRARVELYNGNYAKAFENAKKAYDAHKFLYNMNDPLLFTNVNRGTAQTETLNGINYSVFSVSPSICTNAGNTNDPESNSVFYYKEAYFRFVSQLSALNKMPPSQGLYDLYAANDLRKKFYYDNNQNISTASLFKPSRKDQLVSKSYMKHAVSATASGYLLGVTVPEIMLIMAECRARGAGDGQNASIILKELRKTRFPTGNVDNIGGTLKEVKDERRRELAFTMRWFDLKRYNALDNEGIVVSKLARKDVFSLNSEIVTHELLPNAPAYALPIPQVEIDLLGWKQNEYGGVIIK